MAYLEVVSVSKQPRNEVMKENASEGDQKIKVLFVCLGNICRSPMAEGVFRSVVEQAGYAERFEIRSAGTGDWHVGGGADPRTCSTVRRYGISVDDHCARQFQKEDFERYDHIFVMDKQNLNDVLYLDREDAYGNKVRLFREFDPEPGDYQVPDPYYDGPQGFEEVYNITLRTSKVLLDRLIQTYDLKPADS